MFQTTNQLLFFMLLEREGGGYKFGISGSTQAKRKANCQTTCGINTHFCMELQWTRPRTKITAETMTFAVEFTHLV